MLEWATEPNQTEPKRSDGCGPIPIEQMHCNEMKMSWTNDIY